MDATGTLCMVCCIVFISVGGALTSGAGELTENSSLYLFLAVFIAVIVGLIFALNSLHIFWVISQGLTIDQANYDGNFLLSWVFLGIFIQQISKFGW